MTTTTKPEVALAPIFCKNVRRLMLEKGMSKTSLAQTADIAVALAFDIANNSRVNPTLGTMASVAKALDVPLPLLLIEENDFLWSLFSSGPANAATLEPKIPAGHELVSVVLPTLQARFVRQLHFKSITKKTKGRPRKQSKSVSLT